MAIEPVEDRRPDVGARLVSLAAGTVLDVDAPTTVEVAASAGFPAVGIWFDPGVWSPGYVREIAHRLDATGLVPLDVEPVMVAPPGEGADRRGDHGETIVDAAVQLGARFVLVASRDDDPGRVAARIAALCEHARGSEVRLVLEFLPVLGIRTLDQAFAVVRRVGDDRAGVLVDALHLARSGAAPDDLVGVDPRLLPYLQLCDAPAVPEDGSIGGLLQEALHRRLLPGDGDLPLDALLRAVPEVPLSMELRSRPLAAAFPDPVERARAVLTSLRRCGGDQPAG